MSPLKISYTIIGKEGISNSIEVEDDKLALLETPIGRATAKVVTLNGLDRIMTGSKRIARAYFPFPEDTRPVYLHPQDSSLLNGTIFESIASKFVNKEPSSRSVQYETQKGTVEIKVETW